MFGRGKSILLYMFITFIALLIMVYIWRRIYTLECYSQILQKKLANVRKENKELQSLIKANNINICSLDEAEVIMNKIFMNDTCCTSKDVCNVKDVPTNSARSASSTSTNSVSIVISDIPQSDINIPDVDHPTKTLETPEPIILPVAQHETENEHDVDIESILSDVTGSTTYTRKKLVKMNLERLKEICASMNLPTDGTKNMLIDKILAQ